MERIISRADIVFSLPDAAGTVFCTLIYGLTASYSGSDLRKMKSSVPRRNTVCVRFSITFVTSSGRTTKRLESSPLRFTVITILSA